MGTDEWKQGGSRDTGQVGQGEGLAKVSFLGLFVVTHFNKLFLHESIFIAYYPNFITEGMGDLTKQARGNKKLRSGRIMEIGPMRNQNLIFNVWGDFQHLVKFQQIIRFQFVTGENYHFPKHWGRTLYPFIYTGQEDMVH